MSSDIKHWGEGRDEFPERDYRYHCICCGLVKAFGPGERCSDCQRAAEAQEAEKQ
jgi:hypothetical protein